MGSATGTRGQREQWGSGLGFILATVGAAVGLGNIWRFPTVVGREGGGAFVLVYLLVVLAVGLPAMLAELTLGRHAQQDAVGTFGAIRPGSRWGLVGAAGILASFITVSYYTVIAGWSLAYFFLSISGGLTGLDALGLEAAFRSLVTDPVRPVLWHLLFMMATTAVVLAGVRQGIEQWAKLLMPGIGLLLLILFVRVITLPGALEGAAWFLRPDLGRIGASTLLAATGQVFFSFSLGLGVMITYGSYLGREVNLPRSTAIVALADVAIALLAGITVIAAVFALGFRPEAGPGLLFITLPGVFARLPLGVVVFGSLFFAMLCFAALTSTVALVEAVVAYLAGQLRIARPVAALLTGGAAFLLGVPAALAEGPLAGWRPGGLDALSVMDFSAAHVLLPVSGLLTALFAGWVWGARPAVAEMNQEQPGFGLATVWGFLIRFLVPAAIAVVLVTGLLRR